MEMQVKKLDEQDIAKMMMLLMEAHDYIEREPGRLFLLFCIGLSVGFIIGRFV